MNFVLYCRVSTVDQSLDSQLVSLKEYATRRGLNIINEYRDVGVSGSKDRRPGLDQLMNDARKRKFDGILVFRFDRFARSTRHLANALEEFNALGISFISYSENIDTTTPMGKAMFTIISAMGELEKNIMVERIRAGLKAARSKGVVLGRPIKINIEEIKRLRAEGFSIRSIAKQLSVGIGSVSRHTQNRKKVV